MSADMRCQDKARLIAYLYGEDDRDDREAVAAHLAECAACTGEIEGLSATRAMLSEWHAPDVELGFRIVRDPAPPPSVRWRVPAWAALPAAAVLLLAVAAAAANVEMRIDDGVVTIRGGWNRTAAAPQVTAAGRQDEAWRTALAETERRLRDEFAAASASAPALPASSPTRLDPAQVRALIEASERRQQRELALRIAEVVQDIEAQRRVDLVQIDENLGHIEGLTAARQREVMNYLVRVAEGR